jgi:hypothetical protein
MGFAHQSLVSGASQTLSGLARFSWTVKIFVIYRTLGAIALSIISVVTNANRLRSFFLPLLTEIKP